VIFQFLTASIVTRLPNDHLVMYAVQLIMMVMRN